MALRGHFALNTFEIVKGLCARSALVQRLAGCRAELRNHACFCRTAPRAFHISQSAHYQPLIGTALLRWRYPLHAQLFACFISHPIGCPSRRKNCTNRIIRNAIFFEDFGYIRLYGFHGRTTTVGRRDSHLDPGVTDQHFTHNTHFHDVQHRNFRVTDFGKNRPYVIRAHHLAPG